MLSLDNEPVYVGLVSWKFNTKLARRLVSCISSEKRVVFLFSLLENVRSGFLCLCLFCFLCPLAIVHLLVDVVSSERPFVIIISQRVFILSRNPLAQMEEERREHEAKMKKMEQEMEQVFDMKVKEKTQKLKDSEADVISCCLFSKRRVDNLLFLWGTVATPARADAALARGAKARDRREEEGVRGGEGRVGTGVGSHVRGNETQEPRGQLQRVSSPFFFSFVTSKYITFQHPPFTSSVYRKLKSRGLSFVLCA